MAQYAERMVVVWCPDWSAVASGAPLSEPVAVLRSNNVVSCSPAARREGVSVGLRRREAQSRCPGLKIYEYDQSRDVKVFEPIVATVETLAPRVEILEPGICAVPTRGPSRYFGGDEMLVRHTTMMVNETLRDQQLEAHVGVGVADGTLAACLAAKAAMVVPLGSTADFLAPQPIDVLQNAELVDLLHRLGIRTLGDFAALPAPDVLGRFGNEGRNAHLLARGFDEQPFHGRVAPVELTVTAKPDSPIAHLDAATFAAKTLADELHSKLASHGLSCSRLVIEAAMESGQSLSRVWRHDGRLSAVAIAERLRWQIEGWLTRNSNQLEDQLSGGITELHLMPEGLLPDNGRQLGFWGGSLDAEERAAQALTRVQGLVGEAGVVTAVLTGGRSPGDQVQFVPWGVAREELKEGANPWPGQLPAPAPATVYDVWPVAEVKSADGTVIAVNGRGAMNAIPQVVTIEGEPEAQIASWAGPWLVDERWWDPNNATRRARLQVVTDNGRAYLLALEKQTWWAEACYD